MLNAAEFLNVFGVFIKKLVSSENYFLLRSFILFLFQFTFSFEGCYVCTVYTNTKLNYFLKHVMFLEM